MRKGQRKSIAFECVQKTTKVLLRLVTGMIEPALNDSASPCPKDSRRLDSTHSTVCMSTTCAFAPNWARELNLSNYSGGKMAATNIEQKALALLNTFERAGKSVTRVTIQGRKIELELSTGQGGDEFERIDMRHDQT